MSNLVNTHYQEISVSFTEDAWFNATSVAERFGKTPFDWLIQRDTAEYMAALHEFIEGKTGFLQEFNEINKLDGSSAVSRAKMLRLAKSTGLVKTKSGPQSVGGGTWLHPKLAVAFARWLDVNFAIWCDDQVYQILTGRHQHYDWKRARHESIVSFKVMNQILQFTREQSGKTCEPHHFSNEARLINYALTGSFGKVNREELNPSDLDLIAKLEAMDTVFIGCGKSYEERKTELVRYASEQRAKAQKHISAA
ncbi:MAG: KilA-N domain-containing protein [Xanthomonadales bacterium]|nr:KilA-N domain-containing protein [Xanthomonadales bacterium]